MENTSIIEVVLATLMAFVAATFVTGCGVTSGSTTWGTTSYLKEVNKRAAIELGYGEVPARASYERPGAPMDSYTQKEKQALNDTIRRY
jgi:hypothetical protein